MIGRYVYPPQLDQPSLDATAASFFGIEESAHEKYVLLKYTIGYLIPWFRVPQEFSIRAWQSPPRHMLAILY
jgi:hypothetical protein